MNHQKFVISVIPILALSLFFIGTGAVGTGADLLSTDYYLISIGTVDVPLATLIHTTQTDGYTVIVRSGNEVHSYRGTNTTTAPEKELIQESPLLYVDDGQFLLQVRGTNYDYAVRPGKGENYTLVIVPHTDLSLTDTLTTVITELQKVKVVGSEVNMELQAFPQHPEKSPAPPAGVPIDSRLYTVMISPDWFAAAAEAGLTRVGLRVLVVAEKLPGGTIPEEFRPYVKSESPGLTKLLLPINKLLELAKAPGIGYLRPPYRPHPAVP